MISYENKKRINAMPTAKNAHFDSDSDFSYFMTTLSKTGFFTIQIKTDVHGAEYYAPCERHQNTAICII